MTLVAGDFYDFLLGSDEEAGLLTADVSGHGIPAALIASMVKLAATTQRAHVGSPSDLLLGLNGVLYGNTQSQFVDGGVRVSERAAGGSCATRPRRTRRCCWCAGARWRRWWRTG